MSAHFKGEDWQRQHQADPEAARHVDEFGIGSDLGARDFRLKRHAAHWARAGSDLADLGMHRASVDGAFAHGLGFAYAQIFLRIADELGAAAGGAEIKSMAAMVGAL